MQTIREIQGEGLRSDFHGQVVTVSGVVTAVMRRGFFLQMIDMPWDKRGSNAVFVYSPEWSAEPGFELEVTGKCVDFIKHETAKPVTQIHFDRADVKATQGPDIAPVELTQDMLNLSNLELAELLNSLEAMLVSVAAGQTFIAPSNRYGDYVLALDAPDVDNTVLRSKDQGVITANKNSLRWFLGFRSTNYNHTQRLNVGATLTTTVKGPLNYRVDAYQMAVSDPFKVDHQYIELGKSSLLPEPGSLTIMTLNCFNLDPQVESQDKVINPSQDVDDDWGEGRFHTLAQAVVLQANVPDVVALQEIQDNDGAELSEIVDASKTYGLLIEAIEELCGTRYQWVDVAPEMGADGGQPGGNIRNGFLYNPNTASLDQSSVSVFGADQECFDGSRKPLVCDFIERKSGQRLAVINIHLASKRHQESIFAPEGAGIDGKLQVRVAQAMCIRQQTEELASQNKAYYVTGDFNDTEYSETLTEMIGQNSVNLVMSLAENERYDYNHRGKLQVLMHGLVSRSTAERGAEYEIIHGNELIGVAPGEESNKPSDHAYVIAKLMMG